ncbi:MAG: spore protease YyaC [Syntrophomonadaceae bacterium]|jgi:putative sporulation protein YyaC
MIMVSKYYEDDNLKSELIKALDQLLSFAESRPVIICIGSDTHILDCFGPLVGTMLTEINPLIPVMGTLHRPLNAKNLVPGMKQIKSLYPGSMELAIDAAVGDEDELGVIKLQRGALIPGKALAKNLPPIGHVSLTGIVRTRFEHSPHKNIHSGSLAPVYSMARVTSQAIAEWYTNQSLTGGQ